METLQSFNQPNRSAVYVVGRSSRFLSLSSRARDDNTTSNGAPSLSDAEERSRPSPSPASPNFRPPEHQRSTRHDNFPPHFPLNPHLAKSFSRPFFPLNQSGPVEQQEKPLIPIGLGLTMCSPSQASIMHLRIVSYRQPKISV